MPGLALFLGMLQTMEDQDTLEKVDQGSEMHYMFGYVSDHLYTQKKLFLFYIHNTPQFESECWPVCKLPLFWFLDGFVSLLQSLKKASICFAKCQWQNDVMVANWLR